MRFVECLEVPVSIQAVWDFVWQVDRLAACLPGCTGVEERQARRAYTAHFQDHIGPYKVQFDLEIEMEANEPERTVRLTAKGRDARLGVSQRVAMAAGLRELAPGQTAVDIEADIEVLGKIATLGQFAVKRKAKEVVAQFTANLKRELAQQVKA